MASFCFPEHQSPYGKGSTLKGKKIAPMGCRLFPFRVDPFSEGSKINFNRVVSFGSVSSPFKEKCCGSSSSSLDFWLICRYRGNIPFQVLCMLGRSHTRSPGMSIMRANSQELPLSAVPLCQLLPCHLGPLGPMISINLYVKGCLDCTIGVSHIPTEPSLLQNEIQILNAKLRK